MPKPARTRRLAAMLAVLAVVVGACASPATPSPAPASSAVTAVLSPSPVPPLPSDSPDPSPSDSPYPSDSPSPSVSPSPTPVSSGTAVATRIVIAALGIDLAVVKSPPPGVYPYCNVAMYFGAPMGQPGGNRATYIFAHARDGMFGPIYELTMVKRTPNKMVGMLVDVYTSDSLLHVYKIVRVLPHQLTLSKPVAVRSDQLWLQTSEGPHGTPGKTQVVANPDSLVPADYAASHPKPRIVRCG
ncbi:MAG TPA: hypothetical protein VIR16_13290 [Candidatus Limnocylindrales bacterium]